MEKFAKMVLLADFYGPLLTEKQRAIWDLYYEQDLSLAEIAESGHTTRQAVHDLIKRTEKILADYEAKLGLVARFLAEREKVAEVDGLLNAWQPEDFREQAQWLRYSEIKRKIEDILQGLGMF
ncbi:putative DNA-binding protein [Peptococcaceae bacterium CEB3]|nr:putative DNA-binding protein [Peptococcaceae bacterium CEB3]